MENIDLKVVAETEEVIRYKYCHTLTELNIEEFREYCHQDLHPKRLASILTGVHKAQTDFLLSKFMADGKQGKSEAKFRYNKAEICYQVVLNAIKVSDLIY